jgi:hypothetical protein
MTPLHPSIESLPTYPPPPDTPSPSVGDIVCLYHHIPFSKPSNAFLYEGTVMAAHSLPKKFDHLRLISQIIITLQVRTLWARIDSSHTINFHNAIEYGYDVRDTIDYLVTQEQALAHILAHTDWVRFDRDPTLPRKSTVALGAIPLSDTKHTP